MRPSDNSGLVMAAVIIAYEAVSGVHGLTHFAVPVGLTPEQWAFVLIVATTAPVVSLWFVWRGRPEVGVPIYAIAMAGGFLFGLYFHFLVPNPDHVAAVSGPLSIPFSATAVLIAVTSFLGTAHGLWVWRTGPTAVGNSTGPADG